VVAALASVTGHPVDPAEQRPTRLDSLALLMRDLPRGPLLTAEQEQALARRVQGIDVVVPPPGKPRPSRAEALDRLVAENLRLVISIARGYRGRGVPVEDLIQEGALGLRHAAERFDPDLGNRFSTYAVWWVREAIVHAVIQDSQAVTIPEKVAGQVARVAREEDRLRMQLGRDPSPEEVAGATGHTVGQIEQIWRLRSRVVSLDAADEDGDQPAIAELLAEPGPTPEAEVEQRSLNREIQEALAALSPEERKVVALRYGIGHPRSYSPQELEALMGITRHRARRIEMRALARLRAGQSVRSLRVYVR
jgi:RNA polymerase primary sigma factor